MAIVVLLIVGELRQCQLCRKLVKGGPEGGRNEEDELSVFVNDSRPRTEKNNIFLVGSITPIHFLT